MKQCSLKVSRGYLKMGLDVRLEILTTLYSRTTDKPNLHPMLKPNFLFSCPIIRSLNLSTNSTVFFFAIDPLTEHAKDKNKKAPDMKTTFSKKKEKKGLIAKPEGQKRLPFSAAHLRNHLSTK